MTAGRLEALKKAIVGLEMTVEEVEGTFKLNQHKSETDYAAIAAALAAQADAGSQQIAHLMSEARPQAFANDTNQLRKGARHDPLRQPSAARPPAACDQAHRVRRRRIRHHGPRHSPSACGCRTTSR